MNVIWHNWRDSFILHYLDDDGLYFLVKSDRWKVGYHMDHKEVREYERITFGSEQLGI